MHKGELVVLKHRQQPTYLSFLPEHQYHVPQIEAHINMFLRPLTVFLVYN